MPKQETIAEMDNVVRIFTKPVTKPRQGRLRRLYGFLRREKRVIRAVDGVSFRIRAGECVALLGPNGAGKSTTVKLLCGILCPTSGRVSLFGMDPYHNRTACALRYGVVFGQRSLLWPHVPVIESLKLYCKMYGMPAPLFKERLRTFSEVLGIDKHLATAPRRLSLGERMRCEVAAALLHRPEVIFLDEPTIGLDVVAKKRIRDFIRQVNREEGVTVLLCSHSMRDVEELANRIILISHGRIKFDGPKYLLKRRWHNERKIRVVLHRAKTGGWLRRLTNLPGVLSVEATNGQVELRVDQDQASVSEVLKEVLDLVAVEDIEVTEPDLEDIIRRIFGEEEEKKEEVA